MKKVIYILGLLFAVSYMHILAEEDSIGTKKDTVSHPYLRYVFSIPVFKLIENRLRYLYPLKPHFAMGVQYDLYNRDASYFSIRSSKQIRNSHSEIRLLVGYSF